jgi:hypothetical protein
MERRRKPSEWKPSAASFSQTASQGSFHDLKIQTNKDEIESDDDLEGTPVSARSVRSHSSPTLVGPWATRERMPYPKNRLIVLTAWFAVLWMFLVRMHNWLPDAYHFVSTGSHQDLDQQIRSLHKNFEELKVAEKLYIKKELHEQGNDAEKGGNPLANAQSEYPTMFDPYIPGLSLFSEHKAMEHVLKFLGMDGHDLPRHRPVLSWVHDRDSNPEAELHLSTANTASLRHAIDYIAHEAREMAASARSHGWAIQVEEQVASGIQKQTIRGKANQGVEFHKMYSNISNLVISLTPLHMLGEKHPIHEDNLGEDAEWGMHARLVTSALSKFVTSEDGHAPASLQQDLEKGFMAPAHYYNFSIPTLLLNTHIDSAWGTPGANHAAAPSAIFLETLRVLSTTTSLSEKASQRITFLINGAKEQGLDGAHAFITQHPLRTTIWGLINGAGETVLQATSRGWVQLLKKLQWPSGDVTYSDIFKSGLLLSETDYGIFTTYSGPGFESVKKGAALDGAGGLWRQEDGTRAGWKGHRIVGIDMATYRNNYIYHTTTDTPAHLPPGALLHWGTNIIKVIEGVIGAVSTIEDLDQTKWRYGSESGGAWTDILGMYIVSYGPWTAKLVHSLIVIGGLYSWNTYSGPTELERMLGFENVAKHRLVHTICAVLSLPASVIGVMILIKSPWYTVIASNGQSMSWFASLWRPILIFGPMALFGGLVTAVLIPMLVLVRGSPRSTRSGGYLTAVGFERRVASGFLALFCLMTFFLTLVGFGAAHLPASLVIACIVGLHMSSSAIQPKTPVTPTAPPLFTVTGGFSYVLPMLIAMIGVGRVSVRALEMFVPLMGRISAQWKGMPLGGTWETIAQISHKVLVDEWFADGFIGAMIAGLCWTAWMGWILAILVSRMSMSRTLIQRDVGEYVSIRAVVSRLWILAFIASCLAPCFIWFMGTGFKGDEHGEIVQRKRLYIQYAKEQGHDAWMNQIRVAHADCSWNNFDKVILSIQTLWERPVFMHVANQVQYQWSENPKDKMTEWDLAWPRTPMLASINMPLDDQRRGRFKDLTTIMTQDMINLKVLGNVGWEDGGKRMRMLHLGIDHVGVDYLSIVVGNVDQVVRYGLRVEPGTEDGFHWHEGPFAHEVHGVRRFHIRHTGSEGRIELKMEIVGVEQASIDIAGVDGRTWGIPSEEDVYGVYGNITDVGDEEWRQSRQVMERIKAVLPNWTDALLLVTISGSWTV